MAPTLLATYESLLLSNLSSLHQIEGALRNVAWLLPGRFEDAEVASEGLYTLLNLVSSHHDTLLSSRLASSPTLTLPPHPFAQPSSPSPSSSSAPTGTVSFDPPLNRIRPSLAPPSDHTRYTTYLSRTSPAYRRAARLLQTLSFVQLLVEMLALKKLGARRRWRLVVGIEGMKTALKLIILLITRRPVLDPPTPQREYDLATLPDSVLGPSSPPTSTIPRAPPPANFPPLVTLLQPSAPIRSHLYPMVSSLPDSHLPHPLSLLPRLETPGQWASEIISVSAGLVHLLLLLRAANRSPDALHPHSLPTLSTRLSPLLIPLTLVLLSRRLRPSSRGSLLLSTHQAQQDRRLAARFFLTGPVWVGWTRPKIMRWVDRIERVPLLGGMVGGLVEGYLPLVDDYWFYTSS